jgi:hypothetical protein
METPVELATEAAETRDERGGEVLYGASAIAQFLGIDETPTRHLIAKGVIPTFKIGAKVCARRRTLVAWLDDQERRP